MTTKTLLEPAIEQILRDGGIGSPRVEAAAIADAVCDYADAQQQAEAMARRRIAGTPLEYLLGKTRFMGVDMFINPGALIPREETELLGNSALHVIREGRTAVPRLIDMCCGSGNLACALAVHAPALRVWASDVTDGAVAVARRNVANLQLGDRVMVVQGDLFASLEGLDLEGTVDAVVCNPPYISTGKLATESAGLLAHEPREAFDGGPYGVSILQRVIRDAVKFLKPGGHLLFEIGAGQDRQVTALFSRSAAYDSITGTADAANTQRVLIGRKK
jgi:release factor glutamine methyltransferase